MRTDVERVIRDLEAAAGRERGGAADGREHTVPVCYGGDFGPDLAAVAAFAECSEARVIDTHGAAVYRVYMLGFLPGFAYMGPVDERIAMPRRESPRLRVPGWIRGNCRTSDRRLSRPGSRRMATDRPDAGEAV